jgi:hypothetical protein
VICAGEVRITKSFDGFICCGTYLSLILGGDKVPYNRFDRLCVFCCRLFHKAGTLVGGV